MKNKFLPKTILPFLLLPILLIATAIACGGEEGEDDAPTVPPVAATATPWKTPTPKPAPTKAASAAEQNSAPPDTWLVMLYQDADDEILEKDTVIDLNEAERAGSTDNVTIVTQMDRYKGGYKGDGNWTSAKRFLITPDDNLKKIASTELADLGEVDSGDWHSLVEFATWAIETYPAEKYVLVLGDHGAGWLGGWSDDAPNEGSSFTVNDIDQALGEITSVTGIGRFELVGFDACLMSQLEPLAAVAPYARYAVASEETEPALGWAYASFLGDLTQNPQMDGATLAKAIVNSYIVADSRITDDTARKAYVKEVYDYTDPTTAEEIAAEEMPEVTLAAVDLSALPALNAAVNDLAVALGRVTPQKGIAKARSYTQSFESVMGDDYPPSFIDLGHFAGMVQQTLDDDAAVNNAARQVQKALAQAIVAEVHGSNKPGATGLSIYFPNSKLYKETATADAETQYTHLASRFATASLWDDFLALHYTGQPIDPAAADPTVLQPRAIAADPNQLAAAEATPAPAEAVEAPGAGQAITIAPIVLSADEITEDESVTLSTQITGDNVAYVYLYVSYYDEESESYLTADETFIAADNTREIDGVTYPDWGSEGVGELEVDWEPTIYFMSDGTNEEFAYFEPEIYGVTAEEDTYTVRGIYTFAESGNTRDAVMRFNGAGDMQSVFGFAGANGSGAPREIIPTSGDTFTILEEWFEYDESADGTGQFVDYEGGTLTFGDKRFEMVPYYAYAGDYTLGIIVEDMNGDIYEEYADITVTE